MSPATEYHPPQPLDGRFDREAFDCGVDALNNYLKKYALQNQKRDAARTYVIADSNDSVLGYYTLVFGSIGIEDVTPDVARGWGHYPIPVILLARLAVAVKEKGKGMGGILTRDALLRTVQASDIAGLRAIMVKAKDITARSFYEKLGFQRSPSDPLLLFLKIADIRANLRGPDDSPSI